MMAQAAGRAPLRAFAPLREHEMRARSREAATMDKGRVAAGNL